MFNNYEKYLEFIGSKLEKFFLNQQNYICCKKGCSKCCEKGEYPYSEMELKYLLSGFVQLDKKTQDIVEDNIYKVLEQKKQFKGDKFLYSCPFLINNECCVYEYRGIICRTFGLIENGKNDKAKVPFCAFEGLNYSQLLDNDTDKFSMDKFLELNYTQAPLGFNIGYNFLTSEKFENNFNFKFGDKKTLIDWFINKNTV